MIASLRFKYYDDKLVIMRDKHFKQAFTQVVLSEKASDRRAGCAVIKKKECNLDLPQIQELWARGEREIVKNYVREHYLCRDFQLWLMRTRDEELILLYLKNHHGLWLFEDAEQLLMSLDADEIRLAYLEHWRLRPYSLLQLFSEKKFFLLRKYVATHPEEEFSRTMITLMFEMGDEKLIRQYVDVHSSLLSNTRYTDKLQKFGLLTK